MKKMLVLLLIICISSGILAGCSNQAAKDVDTVAGMERTDKEAEQKELTLTFASHQSGLPSSGIVQELAKEYEEESGVAIDFQVVPDAQWRDLLKVKLNSGEAYDIMNIDVDPLSIVIRINPEKNCVELTDQEWVSRMDPLVLAGISVDDKVYGIQFNGVRRSTMVYNKEIFQDLGLEVPTTYEDFKSVCQAIKESAIVPIYEATQNGWHQVLPVAETGSYYITQYDDLYKKLNNNELDIKEVTEIKEILTEMKEFADSGYFGENFMSQSVEGAREALATGKVAMYYGDTGWVSELKAEYPEMKDKTGVFVAPWADNQTVSANPTCNAYFINKNSKYINEAKGFFEFLARPENLQKMLNGAANLVSLCWPEIKSKEDPEYLEYFNSLPAGLVLQVGVSYIDPQWMDIGKDIDAMYVGTMTPEKVVENIATRRAELAELAQDPAWE